MIDALVVALAALVSAAAALLAWAHVRQVERAVEPDLERLAREIARAPGDRLDAVAERATGAWASALSRRLRDAGPDTRVAEVNEALGDLELELTRGAAWPAAGVRIAALGGLLVALGAFLQGRIAAAGVALVVAVAGALAAAAAGRRAREATRARRRAVDALVDALGPAFPRETGQPGPVARRRVRSPGTFGRTA